MKKSQHHIYIPLTQRNDDVVCKVCAAGGLDACQIGGGLQDGGEGGLGAGGGEVLHQEQVELGQLTEHLSLSRLARPLPRPQSCRQPSVHYAQLKTILYSSKMQ